jgi:Flp pilus assembly protein TadD
LLSGAFQSLFMMNLSARIAAAAALSALGACASLRADDAALAGQTPSVNAAARAAIAREDVLSQMTFWATEYGAYPNDLEAAQRFAEILRRGGRHDRAVQVASEALQRHQSDVDLMRTLGLALLQADRASEALRPLAMVAQALPQDWRARSSLGVALDKVQRYPDAQRAYREALAIQADEPNVLNNLGMSYLLSGDAAGAERAFRQAVAAQGAPPEARTNLAVAVALQGRFEEAEQLARADTPPNLAMQNVAYLRGLFADPRRWGDLRGEQN